MSVKTEDKINIPFNKPFVDKKAIEQIKKVFISNKLSGDGAICKGVELQIEKLFDIKHTLLTTSCTHALEIAMMMLKLKPGDEVITPSFTFVSVANAILRAGGLPVFCDIDKTTLTVDVKDFERKISKRTRAIVPVHYGGVAADMDEILKIANKHNIVVIEDAAQGVNARYKGKFLGTIGHMGAYSFHDTKNYVSGEGGAFLTNSEKYARQAEVIREKGTNRSNFLRGEVDKYTWVDIGSSFVLSEVLAAILKHQLEKIDSIQERRKVIYNSYLNGLKGLEDREKLKLPEIPEYCDSNYHIFYILLHNETERNDVLNKLKKSGIGATFHYIPLHSSPYAIKTLGMRNLKLKVTDKVSKTLLRLPLYPQLTSDEINYIIDKLKDILK